MANMEKPNVDFVNTDMPHSVQSSQYSSQRADEEITWTDEEERALRRKLDYHIVPIVTLLYLLCFIDRSNIGNARIQGLSKDLKLTGFKFNWSLTVFYLTYIIVEIPSNVLLKRIGPKIWIPFLVASFGAVSIGTAFVKSFDGLMIARAFLGLVEGGTMPGISFFLSCFYKREELLFRCGIFISGSSMAGAFGGLLATGLTKIPGWGVAGSEIETWRNIFFFEGLVTLLVGLAAPFFMPDRPENCHFLTPRERLVAAERLAREHKGDSNEKVTLKHIRMAIFNIHTTICALGFLFVNVSVQSISLFMPTILNDMGYTAIQAQLHSVPPYITACALSIAVAFVSDRTKRRGVYLAGFAMLSVIGFALLRSHSVKSLGVKYFAIFLVATGAFPGGPGFLSWAMNINSVN
ncbi:High-affinity nicotinic acid transporter [Venturia nashicola]|uniref:High-affinity nicotinic acid transporter n=1 Tax=Venturia nashicola TaxID=86259 RepID=A0A4Z1NZ63_9PEZI|nr:High-affinity nicotinic acid transporter [Venturia nashicola]